MSRRLLVVDDDPAISRLLRTIFSRRGFDVFVAEDGESALARAVTDGPDLVVLDLELPKVGGMQVLQRLKASSPMLPVIVLTGNGEIKSAVEATRLGAFDYMTKPFGADDISLAAERALGMRTAATEVVELRRKVSDMNDLAARMGPSQAVQRVAEQVMTVAGTSFSVLVLGETGTGKELVSGALHDQSERRSKPFVALDCRALPESLLESELFGHETGALTGSDHRRAGHFDVAGGGTLFLDEIGELPLSLQGKLLRVLESRQLPALGTSQPAAIDVRFIAATNNDLQTRVSEGKFRSDLFFRLAEYTISLPALRDRAEDIIYLAQRFIRELGEDLRRPTQGLSPEAIEALQAFPWPGNVRQLRNVIRQAVVESRDLVLDRPIIQRCLGAVTLASTALVPPIPGQSLKEVADAAARDAERRAICETLKATLGNKTEAARTLRTDFKTLHIKMRNLGIRARDFEG